MSKRKRARKPQTPPAGDLLPPDPDDPRAGAADPGPEPAEKRAYQSNPVVPEIPALCPRCGSAESEVSHTYRFPARPLQIGDARYPGRVCRRRRCLACDRRYISNAPLGDPAPAAD